MRRRTFILSSAGVVTCVAGCVGDDEEEEHADEELPGEATVEITDGVFAPLVSQIGVGGTITWENTGGEANRIDAFQFHGDSTAWSFRETLEPGETATHTFDEQGRYDFYDAGRGQFNTCGRVRVGNVDEGESLPCE